MKNRTPEQKIAHRLYMKLYYQNNSEKREKNKTRSGKRGLEKVPCKYCVKHITRVNMNRHVKRLHQEKVVAKES